MIGWGHDQATRRCRAADSRCKNDWRQGRRRSRHVCQCTRCDPPPETQVMRKASAATKERKRDNHKTVQEYSRGCLFGCLFGLRLHAPIDTVSHLILLLPRRKNMRGLGLVAFDRTMMSLTTAIPVPAAMLPVPTRNGKTILTITDLRGDTDAIIRDRSRCDALIALAQCDDFTFAVSQRETHDDFDDVTITILDLFGRGLHHVRTAHRAANDVWRFSDGEKARRTYQALRDYCHSNYQGALLAAV